MWTIERSLQPLLILVCKVLHEFDVLINQLLFFSQDGHKGNKQIKDRNVHSHMNEALRQKR